MSDADPSTPLQPDPQTLAETQNLSGQTYEISDVVLADDATGAAPSFPAPLPSATSTSIVPPADSDATAPHVSPRLPQRRDRAPMAMLPGAKVDDFEIVKMLGRGAFGHVYLARQITLDRLVALKVSANRGSEGRTMARLEHQHIVQVFSEKVEPDFNQRLLCMQLVPGIGLEKLIYAMHDQGAAGREQIVESDGSGSAKEATDKKPREWNGSELLSIIVRSASLPTELDPAALHDREALARMDAIEATAWFGGRLAEALDFAHHHGVLHRDIKPANILVNPYGRPMLADFNISSQPVGSEASGEEMFGGTFAYMSPEHLDAFNPKDPTPPEAVDARSDIYSLGLVLQQLLAGRMEFPIPERKPNMGDTLRRMADERRAARPTCSAGFPGGRMALERSLAKCLQPAPEDRFTSGAELAEQLDGCRQLREAEKQLPPPPAMLRGALARPFAWLVALIILPQVAGSVFNVVYNFSQIVKHLQDEGKLFFKLVTGYNVIMYPIGIALLIMAIKPVWQCWKSLALAEHLPPGEVEAARLQALRLPRWVAILTAIGWFPGGLLFPLMISILESPLNLATWAHFVASFCLSGMIALAYSLCGVEFVVLRVLYPGMWRNARGFRETARRELAPVSKHLRWIQRLAVAIPLLTAISTLAIGGSLEDTTYRSLIIGLIVLGFLGSIVTNGVTRGLSQVVVTLTSTKA